MILAFLHDTSEWGGNQTDDYTLRTVSKSTEDFVLTPSTPTAPTITRILSYLHSNIVHAILLIIQYYYISK